MIDANPKPETMTGRSERPARIGLLHYVGRGDAFVDTQDVVWFKSGMAKLGYRDGVDVQYLELYGDRDYARTERHARAIVDWRPDVIVSFMTNGNLALKPLLATDPIPVVCWATDLKAAGLIDSYRRPGRNFTGFSYVPFNNTSKVLLLKRLVPTVRRVAHLYNETYSPAAACMAEFRFAVEAMGAEFRVYPTLRRDAFADTIAAISADGCDAVLVGPHELFNTHGAELGERFLSARLPAIGNQLSITRNGGLATISPGKRQAWPLMAFVVDEILRGADPATIPVNRSCRGPMTLNLRTADALALTIGGDLLDEIDVLLE